MVSNRQRTGRGRGGRGGRGRGRGGVGREGTSSPTTDEIGDALNGMIDVQMQNNNDDNTIDDNNNNARSKARTGRLGRGGVLPG